MTIWGADVQQLLTLSQSMQSSGQRISMLEKAVSAQLRATPWKGVDAEAFKSQWEGGLRLQCRQASTFLMASAKSVQQNAKEQEKASQASGGSGSGAKSLPGNPPPPRALTPAQLKDLDDTYRFSDWWDYLTDPDYQSAPSLFESIARQLLGPPGSIAGPMENAIAVQLGQLGITVNERAVAAIAAELETTVRNSVITSAALLRSALRFMPVVDIALALGDMGVAFNAQDPVSMANASTDLGLAVVSTALELTGVGAPIGLAVDVLGLLNDASFMIFPDGIPYAIYTGLADAFPEIREYFSSGQDLVEQHVDPVIAPVVEQFQDGMEAVADAVDDVFDSHMISNPDLPL